MCDPFKWKTLRCCCLWLCRLIFVQKFLWESSKTTRTKTCREENKEQWMETKTGATGASQEACATNRFTRKTCSWTTKTKGTSKSSRSGQACSCSTGKTALIFRACPGIGKKNKFCLIVSAGTTLQSTASLTFRLPVLWVESEPVEFMSSKCLTLVLFIFFSASYSSTGLQASTRKTRLFTSRDPSTQTSDSGQFSRRKRSSQTRLSTQFLSIRETALRPLTAKDWEERGAGDKRWRRQRSHTNML